MGGVMGEVTQKNGYEVYHIEDADSCTRADFIPEKGGVASSIIMPSKAGPREILFLHDYFWQKDLHDLGGGFPFLFPVCARLKRNQVLGGYLYDGHTFQMPIHGFAPYLSWKVADHGDDYLIMHLRETKESLAMYPFRFEVELHYQIADGELICKQRYHNCDDKPMPYYAGFHPYFLIPEGIHKNKVSLNFRPRRHLIYNEDYTDILAEGPLLKLPSLIDNPALSEQLTQVNSNQTALNFPDGFTLNMQANGIEDQHLFSYVQLYTVPDLPFFCIEPWMAFPNAMNSVAGVRWLAPGQQEHGVLMIAASSEE